MIPKSASMVSSAIGCNRSEIAVAKTPFNQLTAQVCRPGCSSAIVISGMYEDFTALDRWTKKPVHCLYQALIVAISTRHADAIDIKFLVDGRQVWVALPHPAWVEYKNRTGKLITDPLAVEIAGHYLKTALETGEGVDRDMYSLTIQETLKHLEAVVQTESDGAAHRK